MDGYDVINPSEIYKYDYEYIIVLMDESRMDDISRIALEWYGIPRSRIIPGKVLQIPYLSIDDYIKLLKSRVSIIASNCWGGFAYNTLGMECLSPTKNCFFSGDGFLKVINDTRKYMSVKPIFSRFYQLVGGKDKGKIIPVLKIDDVEIFCNHSGCSDPEISSTINDWERRKLKINYDNLFYMCYSCDREFVGKFVEKKELNGICFVPFKTDDPKCMTLEKIPETAGFAETVNINAQNNKYSLKYNLVDLLLGKTDCRY